MASIPATCNAGCGKQFIITEMPTVNIGDGIEKTYFACTHCNHEYVAFYTDAETRKMQEKMRKVQGRFTNKNFDHRAAAKQEVKLKQQIKTRMDELRRRIEGI